MSSVRKVKLGFFRGESFANTCEDFAGASLELAQGCKAQQNLPATQTLLQGPLDVPNVPEPHN